jgi:enolase-phosphatase E1
VPAQKLLFGHTDTKPSGDLRGLIAGWFDTVNAGPKVERDSYEKIRTEVGGDAAKWLFLSDSVKEVRAARAAGMNSFVVVRDGNTMLSDEEKEGQVLISSFAELDVGR